MILGRQAYSSSLSHVGGVYCALRDMASRLVVISFALHFRKILWRGTIAETGTLIYLTEMTNPLAGFLPLLYQKLTVLREISILPSIQRVSTTGFPSSYRTPKRLDFLALG